MPATRRNNVRIACLGTMRARRGRQCRWNIDFSSCGGPGSSMATAPDSSSHCPGAVPRSLERTWAPWITKAWLLLTSAILRLAAAKRCASQSAISVSKTSLRPSAWATASRVTSSSVGPRPPERIRSARAAAGGAEAAGENQDGRAAHGLAHLGAQAVAAVADDALGDHFDAELVQLSGEVERVGIDAIAGEHLAADGDDFGVH